MSRVRKPKSPETMPTPGKSGETDKPVAPINEPSERSIRGDHGTTGAAADRVATPEPAADIPVITTLAIRKALERFTLTEPIEIADLELVKKHLRSVYPSSLVMIEVFRHHAHGPVIVSVGTWRGDVLVELLPHT